MGSLRVRLGVASGEDGRVGMTIRPRGGQLAPKGDWKHWAIVGGRGAGKTTAAMVWLRHFLAANENRKALIIAPDLGMARHAADVAGEQLHDRIYCRASGAQVISDCPAITTDFRVLRAIKDCMYDAIVVENDDKLILREHRALKQHLRYGGKLVSTNTVEVVNTLRRIPGVAFSNLYPGHHTGIENFQSLLSNLE